jgi:chromate transport protein ChrA
VALVAASLPSAVIAAVLMATLVTIDRYFIVRVLLAIGTLIAAVLVLSSAWYLVRPYLRRSARARTAAVALTSLVLVLLNATPVQTLLASAIVGAAWPFDSAQGRPFDSAQGRPFDSAQGRPGGAAGPDDSVEHPVR